MPVVSAGALTLDLETGNVCEFTSTEDVTSLVGPIHRRPEAPARRP
jgi:hypothetical protein